MLTFRVIFAANDDPATTLVVRLACAPHPGETVTVPYVGRLTVLQVIGAARDDLDGIMIAEAA